MLKVINTSTAAATLEALKRNKRDARNRSKDIDWRLGDSLRVHQVARRIIRNSPLVATGGLLNPRFNKNLGNVSDPGAELARSFSKDRIMSKQRCVFLHRRTAARGVHNYSIGIAFKKRCDVYSCQPPGDLKLPGVSVERAAAHLPIRIDQFEAVASKHSLGCAIGFSKQSLHHTTIEHGDSRRAVGAPSCWVLSSRSTDRRAAREEQRQRESNSSAKEICFECRACKSAIPGPAGQRQTDAKQPRPCKYVVEHEPQQGLRRGAALRFFCGYVSARGFEQVSVRDTGRAHSLTSTTTQTEIDV